MPETFTPAEFFPGAEGQAAVRGDKSGLIPKVCAAGPALLYAEAAPADTTYVNLVAAPGAGKRIRLHALMYSNGDASTRALRVRFGAGSALFNVGMVATTGVWSAPIPAGRHIEGEANEALQCSLATGTGGVAARAIALYTIEDA